MAKLPQLSGAEVARKLMRLGFEKDRTRGGHAVLLHPIRKKRTVVPMHGNKDIKKGTLAAILKQADVALEDFLDA